MATLEQALGLCRRAGKLFCGTPLVLDGVRKGKAALVLLCADTADNTAKKIYALCGHRGVPVKRTALTKSQLSRAVGVTREVSAVAVPQEFLILVSASE